MTRRVIKKLAHCRHCLLAAILWWLDKHLWKAKILIRSFTFKRLCIFREDL